MACPERSRRVYQAFRLAYAAVPGYKLLLTYGYKICIHMQTET